MSKHTFGLTLKQTSNEKIKKIEKNYYESKNCFKGNNWLLLFYCFNISNKKKILVQAKNLVDLGICHNLTHFTHKNTMTNVKLTGYYPRVFCQVCFLNFCHILCFFKVSHVNLVIIHSFLSVVAVNLIFLFSYCRKMWKSSIFIFWRISPFWVM